VEYQAERFPFLQHGLLIVTFALSAASYSRVCRGAEGFIPISHAVVGSITALLLFFLLRIADEFKDFEEDSRYRPYRAVPRGLVSLRELGWIALGALVVQIGLNAAIIPSILPALLVPLLWLALMTKEFFVRDWLKSRPIVYMISHMLIMPAIDLYTTGLDWLVAGTGPPRGIEFFLVVTFLNGIVVEVGRKIRTPDAEEPNVETYSALYGPVRGANGWLIVLLLTYFSAIAAALYAGFGMAGFVVLSALLLLCSLPALRFRRTLDGRDAKRIELAAGVWTIGMYLTLGAAPMVLRVLEA
jgi:4-hydroxybenzoate polyprenyltransferase